MSVENRIGEGKYVISVDNQGAITQLQQFENQAKRTGENTKRSFQQGLSSAVSLASGIASLGFQYDNLDRAQLRVRKTSLEVSRAMEQVRKLEQQGKTDTLDYAQAKERLAISNEKLKQAERDAAQGQAAFGLSIIQTVATIPQAIKGIQGLTSATKLLDMATSKWTLIAIAAIAAFEGIAHVIKMINPEIDITIESMGTRLLGAFNKASGSAEDLSGTIEDLSDNQRKNADSSRFFEGNLFNMTAYYDEQNKKLKDNVKLLKEKKEAEAQLIELEKKSLTTNKGTLWDNIIKFLMSPIVPSAYAQSSADSLLSHAPRGGNPAVEWARTSFYLSKRPNDLLTDPFPQKPFSLSDIYAPTLNLARKPKSETLRNIEQSIKDEIRSLSNDQEVIRRQREVSGLLALRELQSFRENMIIEFVGSDIYNRIRLRELQRGATPEQAENTAKSEIMRTSKGQIEVLPNGNFVIRKNTRNNSLGGSTLGGMTPSQIVSKYGMTSGVLDSLKNLGGSILEQIHSGNREIAGLNIGSLGVPNIGRITSISNRMAFSRNRSSGSSKARSGAGGGRNSARTNYFNFIRGFAPNFAKSRSDILSLGELGLSQFMLELNEFGLTMPSQFLNMYGGKGNARLKNENFATELGLVRNELDRRKRERLARTESEILSQVSSSGLSRSEVIAYRSTSHGVDELNGIIDFRRRVAMASSGTA